MSSLWSKFQNVLYLCDDMWQRDSLWSKIENTLHLDD